MIPAPIALGLIIREQIIIDSRSGRLSTINDFNKFTGVDYPMMPLPFYAYALLTGAKGEAEVTLTVTNVRTEEEVVSVCRRLTFPDRFREVRVVFRFSTFAFPERGSYLFTLLVDDDWVTHRRIEAD